MEKADVNTALLRSSSYEPEEENPWEGSHSAQCEFSRNAGPMRHGSWSHGSDVLDQAGRGYL